MLAPSISPDGIPIGQGEINNQPDAPDIPPQAPEKTPEQEVRENVVLDDKSKQVEVEKTPDIDFDAFLKVKHLPSLDIPEVAKKPESKPAPKPEVLPDAKPARDLSDLDPEYAPLFKQMSNEAFEKLKPVVLEKKKLAEEIKAKEARIAELEKVDRLPESYAEHPAAFTLTPEYSDSTRKINLCQQVSEHWKSQLRKIKEGASKVDMININEKGEIYVSGQVDADSDAEENIKDWRDATNRLMFSEQAKLQQLAETHKTKHSEVIDWVKKAEAQSFPAFEDPKNEQLRKVVEDTVQKFPGSLRQSPMARYLAKSLLTNTLLFQAFNKQKELLSKPPAPSEQSKAGPTVSELGVDGKKGKQEFKVTMDDFEKVKQGI